MIYLSAYWAVEGSKGQLISSSSRLMKFSPTVTPIWTLAEDSPDAPGLSLLKVGSDGTFFTAMWNDKTSTTSVKQCTITVNASTKGK